MVSRGIAQLKNLKVRFCDWGGSSRGVRDLLQETQLSDLLKKNPSLTLQAFMIRNRHPYVEATYLNGYIKEISLKNMEKEDVLKIIQGLSQETGHQPYQHSGLKVFTQKPSIQGKWVPNMWNNYPAFELNDPRIPPKMKPYDPKANEKLKQKKKEAREKMLIESVKNE